MSFMKHELRERGKKPLHARAVSRAGATRNDKGVNPYPGGGGLVGHSRPVRLRYKSVVRAVKSCILCARFALR